MITVCNIIEVWAYRAHPELVEGLSAHKKRGYNEEKYDKKLYYAGAFQREH